MSVCICACRCVSESMYVCVYLCISMCFCVSLCMSVCLHVCAKNSLDWIWFGFAFFDLGLVFRFKTKPAISPVVSSNLTKNS